MSAKQIIWNEPQKYIGSEQPIPKANHYALPAQNAKERWQNQEDMMTGGCCAIKWWHVFSPRDPGEHFGDSFPGGASGRGLAITQKM